MNEVNFYFSQNSPVSDLSAIPRPLRESESRQTNATVKTK